MNESCRDAVKTPDLLSGWGRDDAVLPPCRSLGKRGTTALSSPRHDWSRQLSREGGEQKRGTFSCPSSSRDKAAVDVIWL